MVFAFMGLPFGSTAGVPAGNKAIVLATTTSTQDSGLLDVLLPVFQRETGYVVKTIAVGSGQAIAMARRGEADVLLVHSPDDEERLVAEGYAIDRRPVMHNDFVIVGSASDPARIRQGRTSAEAFRRIAQSESLFLSRGDGSGTHTRELKIWKMADIEPEGRRWYQQTGLGMGETLNVAAEKKAYTLTDRGTYLALDARRRLGLEVFVQGEPFLLNVYHVMTVNPERWPKVNLRGARAFADFLVSRKAQDLIGNFGRDRYGSPLFFPAGKHSTKLQP